MKAEGWDRGYPHKKTQALFFIWLGFRKEGERVAVPNKAWDQSDEKLVKLEAGSSDCLDEKCIPCLSKHRIKKAHPSFSVHWETDQLKKMKSGMHEAESWWRWGWGTELKTTAIRQARVQLSIPILLYLISCSPRFKKVECQLVQYPFSISPFFIALDDVWRNALFKTSLGSEEALLLVKEESVLLNLAIYYFLPELT